MRGGEVVPEEITAALPLDIGGEVIVLRMTIGQEVVILRITTTAASRAEKTTAKAKIWSIADVPLQPDDSFIEATGAELF